MGGDNARVNALNLTRSQVKTMASKRAASRDATELNQGVPRRPAYRQGSRARYVVVNMGVEKSQIAS